MKIIKVKGDKNLSNVEESVKRKIAIRLMWMPGIKPVMVPAISPKSNAKIK